MAEITTIKTSDFGTKREHGHYSLLRWIWMTFVNIFLSAVVFFLAGFLILGFVYPRVYESVAEIYVAAESGNTKVSASALGQVLTDSASTEILGDLSGFEKVPDFMRIRINTDLGESVVTVKTKAEDPYSAFDAAIRAIDVSKEYLAANGSGNSMRIVTYPEIAKHFSYMFMLRPAAFCALAGFLLALILSVLSHGRYKEKYYAAKRKREQEAASAYAAFSAADDRAKSRNRAQTESEDLIKSLNEFTAEKDTKRSGADLRKIMSAKDPSDESGKIVIPSYTENDNSASDDAVNFLAFNHVDTSDDAIAAEFDDESPEEDLAKLFGDAPTSLDESSDAKGGS